MRLKFRLSNGKKTFFQWDVNQKIILDNPLCTQIHFENNDISEDAYVKEVYTDEEGKAVVDIPDVFLQHTPGFLFYGYVIDDDGKARYTEERGDISVIRRAKPSDYVYTPEEQKTLEKVFEDTVKYIPDNKTDEQKAQARENIDAEYIRNKTTVVNEESDDSHYPTAKAVYNSLPTVASIDSDGLMTSDDKTKLDGIESGAEVNVQADWSQNDSNAVDFIKNRTHYDSRQEETIEKSFTLTSESAQMQKLFDDFTYDDIAKLKSIAIAKENFKADGTSNWAGSWRWNSTDNKIETIDVSGEYGATAGSVYQTFLDGVLSGTSSDGEAWEEEWSCGLYLFAKDEVLTNEKVTALGVTSLGLYYGYISFWNDPPSEEVPTFKDDFTIVRELGELKTIEAKYIKDMYYAEVTHPSIEGYDGGTFEFTSESQRRDTLPFLEAGQVWSIHDSTNNKDYTDLTVRYSNDEGMLFLTNFNGSEIDDEFWITVFPNFCEYRGSSTWTGTLTGVSGTRTEDVVHPIPEKYYNEQVQADWNENDETAKSYVKNRPFYISDTTELATLEFTATSSSKLTRTTTAADMALMKNFYTKGATFRAVINERNRDFTASFDRGYWSGSGQVSFHLSYNLNQTWDIKSSSGIGLTTGQTYSITFYGLYKGHVKIPTDYLPSSLFTQENAPVKFHEEDGTMLTGVEQGSGTTASGYCSHAEGSGTTASGNYSHAEGSGTTASEYYSHAEGSDTTASGYYSHAEGYKTYASAEITHAEGYGTIADRMWQSVSGKYNLTEGDAKQAEWREAATLYLYTSDTYRFAKSYTFNENTGSQTLINAYSATPTEELENIYVISNNNLYYIKSFHDAPFATTLKYDAIKISANTGHPKYAHITGNGYGGEDEQRSNAYTLDWDGNGWFAGDVYVGSTSGTNKDDGSVKLLKESDVSSWAKQATKPTYTASEVGALPDTTVIPSVDGMLKYTAQTLTDSQKAQARTNIGAGTSSFSGSYTDLTSKPTIPDVPSWAMADAKPTYTASEVGAVATAQGTANRGKYLAVGTDGNVTATDISKDNVETALGYTPAKVTEEKWELVKTITVEESVTSIEVTLDEPCSKVIIMGTQPSTESNAVGVTFLIRDSTTNNNISTPYLNAMIAAPTYAKSNYTYIWLDGDRMRCEFMAFNSSGSSLNTLVAYTCPDISVSCNAITGFNFYRGTGFATGIVWNIYGVKKEN